MQTYPLKLSPAAPSLTFNTAADLFVYESGDAGQGGDARICVKPDNGSEIILRPGQRFRVTAQSQRWSVKLNDPAATLTGAIIIGSGEFDDANTLNRVTLDASFANNVTVMNGPTNRLPVSMDPNQTLNIAGNIVAYTTKHISATPMQNASLQMLPASANVNGVLLSKFDLVGSSSSSLIVTILANATAPASYIDGDVLYANYTNSTGTFVWQLDISKTGQIKVPPGKAIWYFSSGGAGDGAQLRSALFTVL